MRVHSICTIGLIMAASTTAAGSAAAQTGLTVGAGLGGVLNERRDLPTSSRDLSHAMAFVGLSAPLLPIELRGEMLLRDDINNTRQRALIASGVFRLPLPIITPYAQVGWGDYNFGDPELSKWSAGVGVRLNLGTVGLFAEGTRYARLDTDLITAGLTLKLGGK